MMEARVRGDSHAQDGTTAQFGNRGWDDRVGRVAVADYLRFLRLRSRVGGGTLQSQPIGTVVFSD